jgi:predicted short-subunit dehydrogenase-like oxidoreductase (DUF2520 family)
MLQTIKTVSIIGAGNVASQLAQELVGKGINIISVTSKSTDSAQILAEELNCAVVTAVTQIPKSDLVLVCVGDDVIQEVIDQIPSNIAVAYTSGSVEIKSIPERDNLGVFYPLQTFSKSRKVEMFEVPFLIEANNTHFAQALFDLAWKISRNVQFMNSEQRKKIHVGAVVVNNFTNHLVYLADTYFKENELDWKILQPLLKETLAKLESTSAYDAQTGPARRNDQEIIEKHLQLLNGNTKEIYRLISESILKTYSNKLQND